MSGVAGCRWHPFGNDRSEAETGRAGFATLSGSPPLTNVEAETASRKKEPETPSRREKKKPEDKVLGKREGEGEGPPA